MTGWQLIGTMSLLTPALSLIGYLVYKRNWETLQGMAIGLGAFGVAAWLITSILLITENLP